MLAKSQEALAFTFEKLLDVKIVAKAVFLSWYQQIRDDPKTLGKPLEVFLNRRILS